MRFLFLMLISSCSMMMFNNPFKNLPFYEACDSKSYQIFKDQAVIDVKDLTYKKSFSINCNQNKKLSFNTYINKFKSYKVKFCNNKSEDFKTIAYEDGISAISHRANRVQKYCKSNSMRNVYINYYKKGLKDFCSIDYIKELAVSDANNKLGKFFSIKNLHTCKKISIMPHRLKLAYSNSFDKQALRNKKINLLQSSIDLANNSRSNNNYTFTYKEIKLETSCNVKKSKAYFVINNLSNKSVSISGDWKFFYYGTNGKLISTEINHNSYSIWASSSEEDSESISFDNVTSCRVTFIN